jgi:tRNA(Arg) A34 adenosine deaminase TadA
MCVGALLESDVGALVYAVPNIVDGAAGTVIQLAQHPELRRRLQVVSGIRQAEAEELFASHRSALGLPAERSAGPADEGLVARV